MTMTPYGVKATVTTNSRGRSPGVVSTVPTPGVSVSVALVSGVSVSAGLVSVGLVECSTALVASSLVRSMASSRSGWSSPRISATKFRAGLTWSGLAGKRWEMTGVWFGVVEQPGVRPRYGDHIAVAGPLVSPVVVRKRSASTPTKADSSRAAIPVTSLAGDLGALAAPGDPDVPVGRSVVGVWLFGVGVEVLDVLHPIWLCPAMTSGCSMITSSDSASSQASGITWARN
ncbi:hypothetical protein ACIBF6_27135 [Streptosporangium amethystogenes]|uniref:hypothetical protein n=1 Tax=Streptosporangium amethystogenes TaxID=2002 RepID=UPI0037B9AA3C